MTLHTALLDLPSELSSLGLNVVVLDGWDAAQGDYLWTDPLTEKRSYDQEPSGFMVHHTAGIVARPVVRTSSGQWSKANAWAGLWDPGTGRLYQDQPGGLDPAIVLTSSGPARVSSGYGFWPLLEDYVFQDLVPPYWDQPNSDTERAANRYVFNVETVHAGDGGPLDLGVWEHVVGLGVALHRMFSWKQRTIGHLTWTRRKLDPWWNNDRGCIVPIWEEVTARLGTAPPIEPPDPGGPPLNNVGRNMQYVREGDTGQEVEYWQVMAIQVVTGLLLEDSDWPTSNRAYIQNMAPGLEWKVWDEAMTAYLSAWTHRDSYGIGATERIMLEAEVDRIRRSS